MRKCSTLQCLGIVILLTKFVKLCHRYGRGQKIKLEKTAVNILHIVLVNQEGSH